MVKVSGSAVPADAAAEPNSAGMFALDGGCDTDLQKQLCLRNGQLLPGDAGSYSCLLRTLRPKRRLRPGQIEVAIDSLYALQEFLYARAGDLAYGCSIARFAGLSSSGRRSSLACT